MALVSGGGRSTLNPDAPLFVPAAYRQVEDFSPEWWQLVTTTTWFRDYWLSQHQDADGFFDNAEDDEDEDDNDLADLLPEAFDFYVGEDFSGLQQAQFQEFRGSFGSGLENGSGLFSPNMLRNGFEMGTGKNTSLLENRKDVDPPGKSLNTK